MVTDSIVSCLNATFLAENYPKQQWLDYASIPPALGLAAIASEDQRFPDHYGIDFVATRVAVKAALQGRSSGGGSTITQQVAKNLFLWEGRNYLRKVLEWGLALLIELIWDKQRILEVYLNIAQFGKQEYGVVEGAALLGKKPQKLRQADAALMIAVLPAPSRFDLQKPSRYMRKRQQQILLRMRQLGGLGFLEKIDRE